MEITDERNGTNKMIVIELVEERDYRKLSKSRYWFDWRTEKDYLCLLYT